MTSSVSIPLIGISTYRQDAIWRGGGAITADVLPAQYARSVERAGAAAIMIPPVSSDAQAAVIAQRLDGLIIAGGADANPALFGQDVNPKVTTWYDDRDFSELALIRQADNLGLPIFGVCRGMQMLAISRGGTLVQHLPDVIGNESHSGDESILETVGYSQVEVDVAAGHRISDLAPSHLTVPCFHHQVVDAHPGFVATAHSVDGVLHAFEQEGDRFVVGVQWHPETMDEEGIFGGFVAAAREFAAESTNDV